MITRGAIKVVFFGDSICYGQLVPPHLTWVTQIAARVYELKIAGDAKRIVLANVSVSGDTTRQALERMPYHVQSHGVDLCVVQFGLNDCNHWATDRGLPRVSPAAFAANLREIADRAHNFGARRVILHTNHPTTRDTEVMAGTSYTYESQNRRYNDIIREVADQAPDWLSVHDIETMWDDHMRASGTPLASLLLDDGLHLSELGHQLYFDLTWPRIESVLQRDFGAA